MITTSRNARNEQPLHRVLVAQKRSPSVNAATNGSITGDSISPWRHLRDWKTVVSFAISALILIFFILTAHLNPAQIWAYTKMADPRFIALAFVVYFGAFIFRGLRWRLLLSKADLEPAVRQVPLTRLIEMIYMSWFVNCLVPAKLGDAYRAYLLNKESGADLGRTLGTVVGERMADVLALVALLVGSGSLLIGGLAGDENQLAVILAVGLGLATLIGAGVTLLRLGSGQLSHLLPERWSELFKRFVIGMLRTFRRDVQLPLYTYTTLIWACEALRIWLVMLTFHLSGLAPTVVLFTALAGSLLSTIPFTPAGLGAVEGASVAILSAFGVATSLAGAVAVMDRVINYWSNIPVGGLLYLIVSRRTRRNRNAIRQTMISEGT